MYRILTLIDPIIEVLSSEMTKMSKYDRKIQLFRHLIVCSSTKHHNSYMIKLDIAKHLSQGHKTKGDNIIMENEYLNISMQ